MQMLVLKRTVGEWRSGWITRPWHSWHPLQNMRPYDESKLLSQKCLDQSSFTAHVLNTFLQLIWKHAALFLRERVRFNNNNNSSAIIIMVIPTIRRKVLLTCSHTLQTFSKSSLGKVDIRESTIQMRKEAQRVEVTPVVTERECESGLLIPNHYLHYIPNCYLLHRSINRHLCFSRRADTFLRMIFLRN